MKYVVVDFYESYFGERLYVGTFDDCNDFCNMWTEATDGECDLYIEKMGDEQQ